MKLLLVLVFAAFATASYVENFEAGWESRWVEGKKWKPSHEMGKWEWTAGKWYGDAEDKGIQTGQDARFYSLSADMGEPIFNEDKDLVIQFSAKHEQNLDCGGAYIKLMPEGIDQENFGGDTDYAIMFGPDICGTGTRRTHLIFTYKGVNLLSKKEIRCETDQLSHLYTMILHPDNTYEVQIDQETVESGSLFENWDFLPAKQIEDPAASKPVDWVDEEMIPDPEDQKPEDYDDIPAQIPDPEAAMPEDWDEEDDGEWEPPMIDNPEYMGPWTPKMIKNPEYIGVWVHPKIDNPDYFEDDKVYNVCNPCKYVGFELWQVKSGTIFDDIIVTNDVAEAKAAADDTWGVKHAAEKEMFDKIEADRVAKEEAERKKMEDERKAMEAEEEEDEEDDDDDYEDEDEDDQEL